MSRREKSTTVPGFVNPHGQEVIRDTGKAGTDHGQYVYELKCQHCGHQYGANGSDIHERKCPACQGGRCRTCSWVKLTMPDDTILCWNWPTALQHLLSSPDEYRHVTVKDCNDWLGNGDSGRDNLAEFFRQRLCERYIDPVLRPSLLNENGFSIMAQSCLLIETFETYRQGWDSSNGKSQLTFCNFFDRENKFHAFKGYAQPFYQNGRCGILHQGETTGGWTISLLGPLFEVANRRVNADTFLKTLAEVIGDYVAELKREPISADIWQKFKAKLKATIKNCER